MSDDQTTQPAATDANAAPAAQPAETGARTDGNDLDSLLAQFETTQPEPQKPAPVAAPAPSSDTENRIQQLEREIAESRFKRDFEPTLKRVRGDLPAEVFTDEELTDWIDGKAKRDPRLTAAFLARGTNPKGWAKVEAALAAELGKKFSKLPDKAATDDREAVTAAVRGASAKAPEDAPKNYGQMSDHDLRQELQKLGVSPTF